MKTKIYYNVFLLLATVTVVFFACSTDGASPVGESGQGGSMARFTIRDNYLYTVDENRLRLFDITEADKPQYLKEKNQNLGWGVETIFVMDSLLFIGTQTGMIIYNVSRPDFPQQLSHVAHITSCDPVVASGNYAYVTLNSENVWCGRNSNELQIYDITDPTAPELKHTERGFEKPRGLGVDGNKLFLCDNGLKVYDISDPLNPVWEDDLSHIDQAKGIDTYDVIPLNGLLLVIGADGLYQFDYTGEKLSYISKIEVNNLR